MIAEYKFPSVCIIVLNWNGKEDTLECLASIKKLDYPNFETIVVDNGSSDGSVVAISEQYPDLTILQTGANLGYAGGNNVGIRWALEHKADYVLLLNNDTVIAQDLLAAFVDAIPELPDKSILGAKIYFYHQPDILWFAGGRWLNKQGCFEHIGYGQQDSQTFNQVLEVDYITGCALFAKASLFQEIGVLNDDFFLTYEETDWCYRAKEKGIKCFVIPKAKLWHKVSNSFGGAESPLVAYFMTRNKLLWAKNHLALLPRVKLHISGIITILRDILIPQLDLTQIKHPFLKNIYWSLSKWLHNKKKKKAITAAILAGLFDYYRGRFSDCPEYIRHLPKQNQ